MALVETQGVRSLYRGLGLTAVGIVPYAGISFCVFETLKERFKVRKEGSKRKGERNRELAFPFFIVRSLFEGFARS